MNKKLWTVAISRRRQSHLMRRRRWLTSMFSSRVSPAARLPRLSSPAMESIGSTGRGENCYRGLKAERCKGTGAVASVDVIRGRSPQLVFEAAKQRGGRLRKVQRVIAINRRRSATSLIPKKIRHWAIEGRKSKGSLNKSLIFRLG